MRIDISRWMRMVLLGLAIMSGLCPVSALAANGSLTGGAITARVESRSRPTFPNEAVRVNVRADYTNPTATAECGIITGPTWAWTIRSVERQNPTTNVWEPQQNFQYVNLDFTQRKEPGVWPSGPKPKTEPAP